MSKVRDLHDFPRLLDYLATCSATLLNLSEVSRSVGIQHETLPWGEIVGIEIKATATPGSEDLSGLRGLQKLAGSRFKRGFLHTGTTSIGWGNELYILPLSALWQGGE